MLADYRTGTKAKHQDRVVVLTTIAYTHLWILEGAIRKWVPGSDQLMYVARDALVLGVIMMLGLGSARRTRSAPIFWIAIIGLGILVSAQMMLSKMSLPVGAVGLRSYIAPMLLAYLVWCYPVNGVWQSMLKTIAAYAPVQATVTIAQVLSPAQSFINKEVGSDAASFVNDSIVRASGTYSAPSGLSLYVPLALAACLYLVCTSSKRLRWFWGLALLCMFVISLASGSRGNLLAATIVLATFFIYQLTRVSQGGAAHAAFTAISAVTCVVGIYWWLPAVAESFLNRFSSAARSEDPTDRLFNQTFDFLSTPFSFLGTGAGSNSMVGINLGSMKPWVEVESIKWVTELGLLGWVLACTRLLFCFIVLVVSVLYIRTTSLAWILVIAALLPVILYGQITHFPSAQGFLSLGLSSLILIHRSARRSASPVGAEHVRVNYVGRHNGQGVTA